MKQNIITEVEPIPVSGHCSKPTVGRSAFHLDTQLADFDGEIWKDVYGYEGLYQVSNKGRIKSCERIDVQGRLIKDKILKQCFAGNNQLMVTLCADGVKNTVYVSHLVGGCFVGFAKAGEVFTHLDSNKNNNCVENISIEKKLSLVEAGVKTRFVSTQKYVGTDKNGNEKEYTYNELLLKYGTGIRSIFRCIEGRENFKTAYGQTWMKVAI